jgi:hypothetical protein
MMSAWVYVNDGRGRLARLAAWLRANVAGRLPRPAVRLLSGLLAAPLSLLYAFVYRPAHGRIFGVTLPAASDIAVHGRVTWREQRDVIVEYLSAPPARYPSRAEFEAWFEVAGLTDVILRSRGTTMRIGTGSRPVRRTGVAGSTPFDIGPTGPAASRSGRAWPVPAAPARAESSSIERAG